MSRSKFGEPYCTCDGMASAGDMAPRIWECPIHGKTGFASFSVMFEQQNVFVPGGNSEYLIREKRDEFWFFCRGIVAWKRQQNGGFYADEDHLWPDVQQELVRLFGKNALKPTNPAARLKPSAFGVPDAPKVEEPPPEVVQSITQVAKEEFRITLKTFFFLPILLWKLAFDHHDVWPFVKRTLTGGTAPRTSSTEPTALPTRPAD